MTDFSTILVTDGFGQQVTYRMNQCGELVGQYTEPVMVSYDLSKFQTPTAAKALEERHDGSRIIDGLKDAIAGRVK